MKSDASSAPADGFAGRTAVITGAAGGIGLALAAHAASLGMKLVLADVDAAALAAAVDGLRAQGADALGVPTDVSDGAQVDALAQAALDAFGAVHLLCNNAGVACSGFAWEYTTQDLQWVIGVNLLGVAHGIRAFVPIMLRQDDPAYVVNTASVAGFMSPRRMGLYSASKHAVVALTEALFKDLRKVGAERIGCSVLCPWFVPTGIAAAERVRPAAFANPPEAAREQVDRRLQEAVAAGRLSADEIAACTFDAIRARRFYVLTHPEVVSAIRERFADILLDRPPTVLEEQTKAGGAGDDAQRR